MMVLVLVVAVAAGDEAARTTWTSTRPRGGPVPNYDDPHAQYVPPPPPGQPMETDESGQPRGAAYPPPYPPYVYS